MEYSSNNLKTLREILKAYKNKTTLTGKFSPNDDINADFTNYNGNIIAYFCGHAHKDLTSNTNGILSICTTSDAAYSDDGYGRKLRTSNECAFDVVVINKDTNRIKTIRIGGGSNREFTY